MHFNELHSAPEFLGTFINRSRFYNFVSKYLKYTWSGTWQQNEHTTLFVNNIGPGYIYINLKIHCLGQIDCIILLAITPIGPMKNKVIHHFHTESNLKALLFSKFIIHGEATMVNIFNIQLIIHYQVIILFNSNKLYCSFVEIDNCDGLIKFTRVW